MLYKIHGITLDGRRLTRRAVTSSDSSEIMHNPIEYGFRDILSVVPIEDERLEIIGEEPPEIERRNLNYSRMLS